MVNKSRESDFIPIKVTFFGDSICVGQGVSIYNGWVTQIAKYLDEYGNRIGYDILVTNASVNGRTTRQALEDMPYSVQSSGVDILVIQFGLNDCNYWESDKGLPRVSRTAFSENLREIIARGFNSGASHILLNNNHPTSRDKETLPFSAISYEESNREYNKTIRNLAQELEGRIIFQDVELRFNEKIMAGSPVDYYLLDDGLHLNDAGHAMYYELMLPAIRSAIDEFITNSRSFSNAKM